MLSTMYTPLPDMVAHASSAGAPYDSEVSTADLDSEAFVTTPSATQPSSSSAAGSMASEAMQLDMLTQLLDSSTSISTATTTSDLDCATETAASPFLSDSVIAMASTSTSAWVGSSPAISPLALKLESPLLSNTSAPTKSKGHRKTPSTSTASASRRKATADPSEKEAKALQRVLRNRAAAQESRDKKRKYVAEIEASNELLQQENSQLLKRLKTVESDNLELSRRLESLTAQFTQMQNMLSQSSASGAGFCQSAVLAKKDERPFRRNRLTNSRQQKLAPTQKTLCTMTSKEPTLNQHQQVYSMTMKEWMDKKDQNREAHLSDQSAAQIWTEISCRSFCNRKRALTLSSSAAASSQATCPTQSQQHPWVSLVLTMVFLTSVLPQLMLNCSTLFLISTGVRSSNPQELQLQRMALSFILQQRQRHQLFSSRLSKGHCTPASTRTIQDNITSLNPLVVEEIVTNFQQGRKDLARGLLARALLSSRLTLGNDGDVKEQCTPFAKK